MFSYAPNGCFWNHRRNALRGYHHVEGHAGHGKDCPESREKFETEIYVYYGTDEYTFEKKAPRRRPKVRARCPPLSI